MGKFEFVMVVISIIIGLAIAEILMGFVEILRRRSFGQIYWLHAVWAFQTFIIAVQQWTSRWFMQSFDDWNYLSMLLLLLPSVALFLACGLLFPKEDVDLRGYYYQQRAIFFSILLGMTVLYSVHAWFLYGNPPGGRGDRFRLLVILTYLPLIASSRPKVHTIFTAAHAAIVFVSFTTLFGGRAGRL